jgi:lipopolysaccharide export system permease protein
MTILDRYLIKELLIPFIFGLASFTFILAGSTVLFPMIGEAAKYGIPVSDVLAIILYKMPVIIAYAFPMSTLLASIMAFSRLSSDLEIMAFRAGGISFFRLLVPVILVGFIISLATIGFNEYIVPNAANSAQLVFRSYRDKQSPTIKQNINFTEYDKQGLPSRVINVGEIDQGLLKSVTVAEYESGQLIRLVRSNSGRWKPSGGWEFFNGVMHNFPLSDKRKVMVIEFEKEFINIQLNPLDLTKRKKTFEEMSARELKGRIVLETKLGNDVTHDLVNYHMKFSVPFACLIFSILGASVGLRPHRSTSAMGIGFSLMIILCYYLLIALGMGLGLAHVLSPVIAAWFPNIIIVLIGLGFLKKISTA